MLTTLLDYLLLAIQYISTPYRSYIPALNEDFFCSKYEVIFDILGETGKNNNLRNKLPKVLHTTMILKGYGNILQNLFMFLHHERLSVCSR